VVKYVYIFDLRPEYIASVTAKARDISAYNQISCAKDHCINANDEGDMATG
jgi:hypothetical protein